MDWKAICKPLEDHLKTFDNFWATNTTSIDYNPLSKVFKVNKDTFLKKTNPKTHQSQPFSPLLKRPDKDIFVDSVVFGVLVLKSHYHNQ